MKDNNINDQTNESSKISITTNRDHSDNDNNTQSDINNNIVIFGDSIPKGINIRNLNTRLSVTNARGTNVVSLVVLHRNTFTTIISQR